MNDRHESAFPKDDAGKLLETQSGLLVQIPVSAEPTARRFFTEEHAAAWLRDGQ